MFEGVGLGWVISLYDHSFRGGVGQDHFFVSASICDCRNWTSRSNSFAERRLRRAALTPLTLPYLFRT